MPELPEAETIVRGLRPRVVGRTLVDVEVVHADVLRAGAAIFAACVRGRAIQGVERRAKNVIVRLSDDRVLAVNLGMTGRLVVLDSGSARTAGSAAASAAAGHPAVRFTLDDGHTLVFDDTRRFGTVECLDEAAWRARSDRLGPEPLAQRFTASALHEAMARSRSPVRSWLLDQRRIAGIGNIYANEALYDAGIDPRRPANRVHRDEAIRLHRALRRVLRRAIEAGGTTLRDYRTVEGGEGRYGRALRVYGREGLPCDRCRTPIDRVVFSNRSAFRCPRCQPSHDE